MHILLVSGPFDFIVSQRPKNILQWTTYIFYRGKWGKFSTQIVCQIPAKLTSIACRVIFFRVKLQEISMIFTYSESNSCQSPNAQNQQQNEQYLFTVSVGQ